VLLTAPSGAGSAPLVIVGVVTAYLVTLALPGPRGPDAAPAASPRARQRPQARIRRREGFMRSG
jgi:hypothetical protein